SFLCAATSGTRRDQACPIYNCCVWNKLRLYKIMTAWSVCGSGGVASAADGGARAKVFARGGKTVPDAAGDQHRDAKAGGLGGPAAFCALNRRSHADGCRHAS